eukprot:Blabericola_migrator_1__5740@NODE_290_length_10281_cov_162_780693_g238_i0_p10_GENE_NODE_290_length_10281_cov_162_780693_g238_i0NODE_290_length_10281_cov_162_780693_g238_i0_p10_ORF_typecomplete_len163_score5_24_NODE_290_length_10281_cov_162_780693_g238_i052415729
MLPAPFLNRVGHVPPSECILSDLEGTKEALLNSLESSIGTCTVRRRFLPRLSVPELRRSHSMDHRDSGTSPIYDPMGFQWPYSQGERIALNHLYCDEFQQGQRTIAAWKRLLSRDPDLTNRARLKRLARLGIPHQLRPYIWTMALGAQHLGVRNRGLYTSGF